jgi:hypothetical protein
LFEFTKAEPGQTVLGQTYVLEGAYTIKNVGTNIDFPEDTVTFVIFACKEGYDPQKSAVAVGTVTKFPDGRQEVNPILYHIVDEYVIVCATTNCPVGAKFYLCLDVLFDPTKASP